MAKNEPWVDEVLRFWFKELQPAAWWRKDAAVDGKIRARFGDLHESFRQSVPRTATSSAEGALAALIVLDQFPRNIHRRSARAFETDALALGIAQQAVAAGFDMQVSEAQRQFFYMPFEHSEDRAMQARSLQLFTALGSAELLRFAKDHKEIVDRFGRFPHRNKVLGRESTAEEVAFLKEHPGF